MIANPAHQPASNAPRCFALIPAAGVGQRAGVALPKQYADVAGQTVIARTLRVFAEMPDIASTLVVLAPDDAWFDRTVPVVAADRLWVARCGGASRAESVLSGLRALQGHGARPHDWVLVHDAARCLVRSEWIRSLIAACEGDGVGGLLAVPVADTLKMARDGRSCVTVDRSDKWLAQTPQMFRLGLLYEALQKAGPGVTDEASAIEMAGHEPLLVRGDARNLKITWPQDFEVAAALLRTTDAGSIATEARGFAQEPK